MISQDPSGQHPRDMVSTPRAVIWVIDDVSANHDLVRRSLPPGFENTCVFRGYLSGEKALDDLADALAEEPDALPDIVFMDFFLGTTSGDQVTVRVRAAFHARGLAGPFIVGHSSSPPASLEIVKHGGDVAIEKDRRVDVSRGVRSLFPDVATLGRYAGRARRHS